MVKTSKSPKRTFCSQVFQDLWRRGLEEYDELLGIAWEWQLIDGGMYKAPIAREAEGRNPTDRGKIGSKRHLLVDGPSCKKVQNSENHTRNSLKS